MDDDWASGGEDEAGLGDISAIPQVTISEQIPKPVQAAPKSAPPVNAWAAKRSGDVRNALRRQQFEPRQTQTPTSRQQRHENPPAFISGNSERTELPNPRPGSSHSYARAITLYVTNLPYDASEDSVAAFFQSQGVLVTNVRIIRHADTGNIKAAFVRIPPEQNKQYALSVNGRLFGSRSIHVKVDAVEASRRRDRSGSLGSVSYGGNFNAHERREMSSNGWGNGPWGDRPSASADDLDRRVGNSKEDRRRDTSQVPDPTIPTGPPPLGRRKLQLKPRTKPLPVLDVDRRTIDPPRAPASAPPVLARDVNQQLSGGANDEQVVSSSSSEKSNNDHRSNSSEGFRRMGTHGAREEEKDVWTATKNSGVARQVNSNPTLHKKEDDSKRPVLLNAFAALEVNDSDA